MGQYVKLVHYDNRNMADGGFHLPVGRHVTGPLPGGGSTTDTQGWT